MREETILNAINDLDSINCMIQDIHESIYQDSPDYWTKLEHQYAGMVMQSILQTMPRVSDPDQYMKAAIDLSVKIATALVEKLKE